MALVTINPIDLGTDTSFNFYENIANSKNGDRKKLLYGEIINDTIINSDLYKKIEKKYQLYDSSLLNLELLIEDTYNLEEKLALQHCYNSSTNSLEELKNKIIQNQTFFYQSKCAYCGIDGIDGMDHYIPKEKFPEYSVHPHNLIPACSFCNGKKSDLFLIGSSIKKRAFFNPYFDEVNRKVLKLEIEYIPIKNNFSFKCNLEDDNYKIHFEKLKIIKRYEKEAIIIFDNLRIEILSSFVAHIDEYKSLTAYEDKFKIQLEKSKNTKLKERGINSLDYLVYDAFFNSAYCDIEFFISKFGNEDSKVKLNKKILQGI